MFIKERYHEIKIIPGCNPDSSIIINWIGKHIRLRHNTNPDDRSNSAHFGDAGCSTYPGNDGYYTCLGGNGGDYYTNHGDAGCSTCPGNNDGYYTCPGGDDGYYTHYGDAGYYTYHDY
jgi:hypothetical protein